MRRRDTNSTPRCATGRCWAMSGHVGLGRDIGCNVKAEHAIPSLHRCQGFWAPIVGSWRWKTQHRALIDRCSGNQPFQKLVVTISLPSPARM